MKLYGILAELEHEFPRPFQKRTRKVDNWALSKILRGTSRRIKGGIDIGFVVRKEQLMGCGDV